MKRIVASLIFSDCCYMGSRLITFNKAKNRWEISKGDVIEEIKVCPLCKTKLTDKRPTRER